MHFFTFPLNLNKSLYLLFKIVFSRVLSFASFQFMHKSKHIWIKFLWWMPWKKESNIIIFFDSVLILPSDSFVLFPFYIEFLLAK